MSLNRILALSLLLLFACRNKKSDDPKENLPYRSFIEIANNDKQPRSARLSAARQAVQLSVEQHNDKSRIEALRITGVLYWEMDSADKAMKTFRELSELTQKVKDSLGLGIAYNNLGLLLSDRAIYDSAIIYYEKAGRIFSAIRDSVRMIQHAINAGIAYKNIGAYEKAFAVTTNAASLMDSMTASSDIASALTTLGNTLKDLRRPTEALAYHERALSIRRNLKDSVGEAGSLNNIGNIYKSEKQYSPALHYYLQSLEIKRKSGSKKSRATTLDNIAETYLGLKQYALARQFEQEALFLRPAEEDKDGWMTSAGRMARIHMALNDIAPADSLARLIDKTDASPIYLKHQLTNALLLADISRASNDKGQEIRYLRAAMELKDSLFSSDMSAAISRMNTLFRTEEQQKKLEIAEKNEAIRGQQVTQQRYFILLLACALVLLLAASLLLVHSNGVRKKARERTELLMSELNHRVKNNLQIVSGILHLQTMTTRSPGELEIIEAGRRRVQSIGILHNLLYRTTYTGSIDMGRFIAELTANLDQAYRDSSMKDSPRMYIEGISLSSDQAVPLGLIANELLTNIYKYGRGNEGPLEAEVRMAQDSEREQGHKGERNNKGKCTLMISDTGLAWDIRGARAAQKGLGLLLVRMLVEQLQASWESYREADRNVQLIRFDKR